MQLFVRADEASMHDAVLWAVQLADTSRLSVVFVFAGVERVVNPDDEARNVIIDLERRIGSDRTR